MADPTVVSFRNRFPEFETTGDTAIGFAIEEAMLIIGSWTGRGRVPAIHYLAAHLLALASATSDSDGREVISEHIGRLSQTFKAGDSTPKSMSDLATTAYGRRYQWIRRLGESPMVTIGRRHIHGI